MKLKNIGLGVIVIVLLSIVAGCSDDKNESATTSDGKEELQIATWANESEAKEFDEIINQLNKKSDTYTLKQMVIPQDYYTKIQTMIAGNTAPDLLWLAQEYIPAYAENDAVMDLSAYLSDQDTIDMTDYFSGSLDTAIWKEKTYGLPWIGQPYVVYYNKDLFEVNGLTEPKMDWTWEEFSEIATQLTNKDVYGFANTGSVPSAVFAWGHGSDLINENGEAVVNTPKSIEGLTQYYEISSNKKMTMPYEEAQSLGVEQGFVTEKIAMMIGGANDDIEKKVKEAGESFEVGMAVMPAGPVEQVTFNWTASTLISNQTKNKEVAFEALVDVTEAMFEWKVPAPVKSKADLIVTINPYKEYALDVIQKSMEISRGFNNLPEQNELGAKQWESLDLPIISNNNGNGGLNIKKTADETQKDFEAILDE